MNKEYAKNLAAAKLCKLESLRLSSCNAEKEAAQFIAQMLADNKETIKEVDVHKNNLSSTVLSLLYALQGSNIEKLDFSHIDLNGTDSSNLFK